MIQPFAADTREIDADLVELDTVSTIVVGRVLDIRLGDLDILDGDDIQDVVYWGTVPAAADRDTRKQKCPTAALGFMTNPRRRADIPAGCEAAPGTRLR